MVETAIYMPGVKEAMMSSFGIIILITAVVVGIASMCSLICCMENARVVPKNYILLFLFTICYGY